MGKIYTKTGDKGETTLVGGQKVSKGDPRLAAYGTVDELNSIIGFVRAAIQPLARQNPEHTSLETDLAQVQHWLFNLGSLLAAPAAERAKFRLPPMTAEEVKWFEQRIDAADAKLTPLKNFVLPAGCEVACRLHIARAVSRRAERLIVALPDIPDNAIPFMNRLSDYLFTMARLANHLTGTEEPIWKSQKG